MITELAVAQGILAERESKMNEAQRRWEIAFARTGAIAAAPDDSKIFGKVVSFAQGLRSARVEQRAPMLAGDAAA